MPWNSKTSARHAAAVPVVLVAAAMIAAGRSPAESTHSSPADSLVARETSPEPFTFQAGRTWRATAERLERHNNLNGVLRHLERVIERETGSRQAEARLWRGAFIFRHGLEEKAGAVFDSLLAESPRYSLLLAAPIAENAWRAALANGRPAAAERALDAWRAARRELARLGLPSGGPLAGAAADSVQAEGYFETGRLYLRWEADRAAGRRALERSLAVGLTGPSEVEARLLLAQLAGDDGAYEQSADALNQLLDQPARGLGTTLVRRVKTARADSEYRAGRFGEARLHYDELLAATTTAADSQWVLLQLGDSSQQIGEDDVARRHFEEYLRVFPHGTWAEWIRFSRAELDSLEEGS